MRPEDEALHRRLEGIDQAIRDSARDTNTFLAGLTGEVRALDERVEDQGKKLEEHLKFHRDLPSLAEWTAVTARFGRGLRPLWWLWAAIALLGGTLAAQMHRPAPQALSAPPAKAAGEGAK